MSEQELQALLARVAALEEKNAELESKFGELENQVDTVNKFVSAITESQSLENTMNEIESVTKQLTNCDKATFYCYDNTNDKFFSHGDYRNWQSEQNAEELKNAFESKDTLSDGKEAVIPLVSSGGKSVGVIVAEKSVRSVLPTQRKRGKPKRNPLPQIVWKGFLRSVNCLKKSTQSP
mgnify:CR=1 FL=1